MFYACFTLIGSWEGGKNFRVGIFLNKKLVRVGLQETNNFFLGLSQGSKNACILANTTWQTPVADSTCSPVHDAAVLLLPCVSETALTAPHRDKGSTGKQFMVQ